MSGLCLCVCVCVLDQRPKLFGREEKMTVEVYSRKEVAVEFQFLLVRPRAKVLFCFVIRTFVTLLHDGERFVHVPMRFPEVLLE